ncbi:nucleic acid/nucleotide deaminase domain-containing protein [Streptomyces sp. T-3]|nr:nucleic acid/nucleotide deaminase domain-containing protein [Streptomyces sp. T-3]
MALAEAPQRPLPHRVARLRLLLAAAFAITAASALGVLLAAPLSGQVLGRLAYATAPGILGLWLALRTRRGGKRTYAGLAALQVWLTLGAFTTLGSGSGRGVTQLLIPAAMAALLYRRDVRDWFRSAPGTRDPGRSRGRARGFSPARMLKWRHSDEGQTTAEYAGLLTIIAGIVLAVLALGIGPQVATTVQNAVCSITGMGCAAPPRGEGDTNGNGSGDDGSAAGDDDGNHEGDDEGNDDEGCFSGVGAFFGCAKDQTVGAVEGIVVDGAWGDIKDTVDSVIHPVDTVKDTVTGLWDYGKDWVTTEFDGYRDKWNDGDYLGIVTQAVTVNPRLVWKLGGDFVVTPEAREAWSNGEYGRSIGQVLWNGGSLFIPGLGEAKIVQKLTKLRKITDGAHDAEKNLPDGKKPDPDGKDQDRDLPITCPAAYRPDPHGDGSENGNGKSDGGPTVVLAVYQHPGESDESGIVRINNRRCGRIGLNDPGNTLSQLSMRLRMEHNLPSTRNIAVYRIGEGPNARYIAAPNEGNRGLHSEQVLDKYLKDNNISPDEVTGVYSERQPCISGAECAGIVGRYPNAQNDISWSLEPDVGISGKKNLARNAGKIGEARGNYQGPSGDLPGDGDVTWLGN